MGTQRNRATVWLTRRQTGKRPKSGVVFTCSDTKIIRTELENTAIPLSTGIQDHKVVTQSEWIASRKELLLQEKEFTKLRDELGRQHDSGR